jgi:hypothetical protein
MSLKAAVMLGAAGAAAVFAARSFGLPVVYKVVIDVKPNAPKIPLPLPHIGKAGDFGYEWAIVPAAIGYFLSK